MSITIQELDLVDLPNAWDEFIPGRWQQAVDVRDFIQANVTPYVGDATFLSGATARTRSLWEEVLGLFQQ
jgi:formate C-acetyltransferase